jgi:hypothetical protein
MPAGRSLSSFTFDQIIKDITALNEQSEITSDTMEIRFDKIIPDTEKHCLYSYFFVRKDTVVMEYCQSLYPAKFGYIAVLSYRKTDAIPLDEVLEQLRNLIQVHPDYQYEEPKKRGITFLHVIISLAIGALVYGLIAVFTKKRTAS